MSGEAYIFPPDNPQSREELLYLEVNADDMSNRLKRMLKASRDVMNAYTMAAAAGVVLADELRSFAQFEKENNNELTSSFFMRVSTTMNEISNIETMLAQQQNFLVVEPMEYYLRDEVRDLKEIRARYKKSNSDHEAIALRYASQGKRVDSARYRDVESELVSHRSASEKARFDLLFKLRELQAKKSFDFAEKLAANMYAYTAFFHSGYDMMTEQQAPMQSLVLSLQSLRREFLDVFSAKDEMKNRVEIKPPSHAIDKYGANHNLMAPESDRKTPEVVHKEGFLYKKSSGMLRDWTRRYFCVRHDTFIYYHPVNDLETTPMIYNVALCNTREVDDIDRRFTFEVIFPNKHYVLQAESVADMHEWMHVIRNCAARTISGVTSDVTDVNEDVLHTVYSYDKNNSYCADCSRTDPTWASLNLGICICIHCAGVHRSLGTHLSRIQSLVLDARVRDYLTIVRALGNTAANGIYEGALQSADFKLKPDATREERTAYITAKYVNKKFAKRIVSAPDSATGGLEIAGQHIAYSDIATAHGDAFASAVVAVCQNDFKSLVGAFFAGADLSIKVPQLSGRTLLHIAIIKHNAVPMIEYLVTNSRVINDADHTGSTPLMLAIDKEYSSLDTVVVLLRHRCDVNESHVVKATENGELDIAQAIGYVHDGGGGVMIRKVVERNKNDLEQITNNYVVIN